MKLLNWVSVALFSLLCLVEFGSTKRRVNLSDCELKGNTLTACAFIEYAVVMITIICATQKSMQNSGNFISCVANQFVPPYNRIFQKFMNGMVKGGYWAGQACPKEINILNTHVNSLCPHLITKLSDAFLDPVQTKLGLTQQTTAKFDPACGVSGSTFEACSLIEFFSIFTLMTCNLGKMFINIGTFILCVAHCFKAPFNLLIENFFYGLIEGVDAVKQSCSIPLKLWTRKMKSMCPRIFSDVSNVLVDLIGNVN